MSPEALGLFFCKISAEYFDFEHFESSAVVYTQS